MADVYFTYYEGAETLVYRVTCLITVAFKSCEPFHLLNANGQHPYIESTNSLIAPLHATRNWSLVHTLPNEVFIVVGLLVVGWVCVNHWSCPQNYLDAFRVEESHLEIKNYHINAHFDTVIFLCICIHHLCCIRILLSIKYEVIETSGPARVNIYSSNL